MKKHKILLVDDEANLCELISRGLKKISANYDISYVGSGQEALDILEQEEIDALITDIRMPGMDGLELLEQVSEKYVDLPAIVLTGHGDLENAIKALRLGAANYIKKPVSFELLHYSIVKAIEKRDLTLQVKESEQKYRHLYENALMGVGIINSDGMVLEANDALYRMLGTPGKPNDNLNLLRPNMDTVLSENLLEILKEKGEIENFELALNNGSQNDSWINLSLRPISHQNDVFMLATCNDITVRKTMETELQTSILNLENALAGTVHVVSAMVELRDPYTAGHQRRVAGLARAIAKEIGMDENTVDGIHLASIIHDLGKIAVPFEILGKPTALTATEFNLIKVHPEVGYEVLKGFAFPWPIADIVYQHHERLDGSGYPRGLKKDDILIEARILSVADVVEAIATHRPYRPALGITTALNEIRKYREIRYDLDIVDVCLKLFWEKNYKFE